MIPLCYLTKIAGLQMQNSRCNCREQETVFPVPAIISPRPSDGGLRRSPLCARKLYDSTFVMTRGIFVVANSIFNIIATRGRDRVPFLQLIRHGFPRCE
jgi:hypothetical protein